MVRPFPVAGGPMRPPHVAAVVAEAAAALREAGVEEATTDARALVAHALGVDRGKLLLANDRLLTKAEIDRIAVLIERRMAREPVARIIGERAFWTGTFQISPGVLDPRPDTETLVEAALKIVRRERPGGSAISILDLGTGSGAILLSLLAELPDAWGLGVDRSFAAIKIARKNAEIQRLVSRVSFFVGDWASALSKPFDLVVSNPPYIRRDAIARLEPEVREHDPVLALDGGVDGLSCYRNLAREIPRLRPGAVLLEIGTGQAQEVSELFSGALSKWAYQLEVIKDLAGHDRCVALWAQGLTT